jgi:16S rRNA (cytidine1402-2'-O)-methyltransferase
MTKPLTAQRPGSLYVVATPIGNLGDISQRAIDVLSKVNVIAAEDTRHTGQLLKNFGIATPLLSLHDHNESQRAQQIINRLQAGDNVALVSDAGTPLISDPGFNVVRQLINANLAVIPVPGACAAIAALSVSGLPTDRFVFEGFLPAKSAARRERLNQLQADTRTVIFYESPHRIFEAIKDLGDVLGNRQAVMGREITKQFESFYYGSLHDLLQRGADPNMSRGEIVLLVAGAEVESSAKQLDAQHVLRVLLDELPASTAAKLAAKLTGTKRAELYELAIKLSGKNT